MTKSASMLSVGGVRRLTILKPLAILLAMLMLPPELPFFGRFSLTPKADAQITVCGRQASIFQVCSPATNAFETEARSDYETQYNLKPGDGSLIYTYGRTDLRGSLRAFMFNKLVGAILNAPANRTGAESAMVSYFQDAVQQHEIAQYTAATADRDLFQQHLCQWVPDTDLEAAYGESVVIAPYCGAPNNNGLTGLFNGPPDLPTIDYFIAKGYKVGYVQPLEAVVASNAASQALIPGGLAAQLGLTQAQIAEIAALGAVSATSGGVMLASRIVPRLKFTVFPTSKSRLNIRNANIKKVTRIVGSAEDVDIIDAATRAIRLFGAVSVVLEIVTTVISVVFAVLNAEAQKNEIDTLNADLANAKNNPPDLASFVNDSSGTGMDKLTSVFLELTLPEFEETSRPYRYPAPPTRNSSPTRQASPTRLGPSLFKIKTAECGRRSHIAKIGS